MLENAAGRVVAIEVKAAASVSKNDLKHLHFLRDQLGDRFLRGVLLYTGTNSISFDEQMEAAPLSILTGNYLS